MNKTVTLIYAIITCSSFIINASENSRKRRIQTEKPETSSELRTAKNITDSANQHDAKRRRINPGEQSPANQDVSQPEPTKFAAEKNDSAKAINNASTEKLKKIIAGIIKKKDSSISSTEATKLLSVSLEQVIKNKYTFKQNSEIENILYAIDAGANLEIRVGKLEETVIHVLARAANKKDYFTALQPRIKPALYLAKNKLGQTPLQVAIITHDLPGPIIEFLLDPQVVDSIDHEGLTALHHAILKKSMIALKKLVEFGADPNAGKKWRDVLGQSDAKNKLEITDMLTRQEKKLARKKARSLIEQSAPVAQSPPPGRYVIATDNTPTRSVAASTAVAASAPVHAANCIAEEPTEIQEVGSALLQTLINEAADNTSEARRAALFAEIMPLTPNLLVAGNKKKTILHILALADDLETARVLQEKNPEQFEILKQQKDSDGNTPLAIAAKNNRINFLQLFINVKNSIGLFTHDFVISVAEKANDSVWESILNTMYLSGKIDMQNIEFHKKLYTTLIISMGKERALKLVTQWLKIRLVK